MSATQIHTWNAMLSFVQWTQCSTRDSDECTVASMCLMGYPIQSNTDIFSSSRSPKIPSEQKDYIRTDLFISIFTKSANEKAKKGTEK